MKRVISILITVIILGVAFYYFVYIYGWMEFRRNTDTPEEFVSKIVNTEKNYEQDRLEIVAQLKTDLLEHKDFFHSREYYEGTEIIIDTIVYSPGFDKLGVLILTKNPTSRLAFKGLDADYYFNATYYLGTRKNDSIFLSHLGESFGGFTDKAEISKILRRACFRTFVSKDTTATYSHKYNFDDTRFWTGSEWEVIEEKKIKQKKFEEEKRLHPENVYEPPD